MTIVTSMLRISHNGVLLKIPTPLTLLVQAQELAESFANSILPDTVLSIELHAQFLQFCSSRNPALARVAFDAFEHAFCPDTDIHAAIKDIALTEPQARVVVRGYFSVWGILPSPPARRLALFTDPGVKLMATFGGQGGMDNYMDELSWLVDVYRPLVFEFFATMAEFLRTEAMDTRIAGLYKRGLDVANWVARPETLPELPYMLHVPVSMPVVGLIHLMHLMVLYKTLRMTPGELAQSFHVATGHSQGISIAAAMSMVTDEESFYDVSRRVLGILLLAGAMPQLSYPSIVVNPEIEADSIEHEGVPFPMASIQGLPRSQLRGLVDAFNSKQPSRKKWVYLSLINTSQKSIVSGEVTMVVAFVRTLRCISAAPGEDQSRVPFTRRKPRILVNYISMTAPYHCELLRDATTKQHMYAVEKGWILDAADMRVPVRAGDDAHDIRAEENLTKYLFESICVLPVNWPVAITNTGSTHIVDFGPGGETGFASLTFRNVKGRGIAVICASSLTARLESPLGTKADLFRENIGHVVGAADWERDFSPRLVRTMHDNKVHIDTRMSRVLGCPTNMVPGMTPATAGAEFVAAVANAGYHVELAGGGMHSEQEMRERISRLTGLSPPGTGITLNCIYINQRQWLFQFPLLLRMRREGYPISGLCIGGGVPSLDQANQVIHGLRDAGIRHVAFKPGNLQTIRAVISIARANPDFPVILQWTGGRAGGHHSYEDFHQPILNSYSTIRAQRNIVLVGGSGFGGHQDSVPYLTGEWSLQYDDVRMPFDGILFGSRVMTAREGSAADACKQLMAAATGVDDDEWANTYTGVAGGVTSVISEFGEHIHVLDTRCTRLWKELDATVFSQPRTKRLALLQAQKPDIIQKLNADYLRPWFGKKSDGSVADLEDMTYMEVIERLAELMYIKHHSRWVHPHWRSLFAEFAHRTIQRLGTDRDTELPSLLQLSDPAKAASELKLVCPQAANHLLASEDIQCFVSMCRQRGRKPVPFIPVLDDDFEVWFKKDALWQAEDIDAVIGQDVQRTFILYGPVAARFPVVANEPIKDLLDGIYQGQIAALLNQYYDGDESRIPVVPYLGSIAHAQPLPTSVSVATVDTDVVYRLPANVAALPDTSAWLAALSGSQKSWLNAIFSTAVIVQGTKYVDNYVRRVMRPRPCQIITVSYCNDVPVRVEIINSHGDRELMLSIDDSRVISLVVFASNGFEQSELCLRFRHHPSIAMAPIHEILDERDELIRKFYVQMWSAAGDSSLSDLTFAQKGLTVTQEHVSEFCRVIDNHSQHYKEDHGCQLIAPMDFLFVLAWPSILRSLTSNNIHCGLLNIVHLSNSFNFVDGSDQIAVSDTVDADAKAIEVVNTAIGKRVTVEASIYRNSARIATINSVFLYRGVEIDFGHTFTRRDNNVVQVRSDTMDDIAVLESKEWISWLESDGRCSLCPGDTLEFCTDSLYQYMTQDIFSSVSVSGKVYCVSSRSRSKVHVADIMYESGVAHGDPVASYLDRLQRKLDVREKLFPDNGYAIVPKNRDDGMFVQALSSNWAYSYISGDYNPIHTNPYISDLVGLPGTITHGMWTSASTRSLIERYVANDNPERVRAFKAQFVGMVLPGDKLETKLRHVGMKHGRMLIAGETFNADGKKVLVCTAEVDQAPTAYVFTGQGSQQTGMGMDLYKTSAVARGVWDRADKYMLKQYGVSLLDIVRSNPKEYTVHFGGAKGAQIRQNYIDLFKRGASSSTASALPNITSRTRRYTHRSPMGLLHATQFTQPAIIIFELATVADLRSRALIHEDAVFAGHSLGEYIALAATSNVFTIEDTVDITFYRGMVMQSSVERDEFGRSPYGMVAANPSRVHRRFGEKALSAVVDLIGTQTSELLEIVNYNIQSQQYVVAGRLTNLNVLQRVLDTLFAIYSRDSALVDLSAVSEVVNGILSDGPDMSPPQRGRATIPLAGIDVPFHSSLLLNGVEPFRLCVKKAVFESKLDYRRLINRYIPNLTSVPFDLTREYFEMVYQITNSMAINHELQEWGSVQSSEDERDRLARVLLTELLAYQFASPVRWIETQNQILCNFSIRRLIEIGPTATLCGMAQKTLSLVGSAHPQSIAILHSEKDEQDIGYLFSTEADMDSASDDAALQPEPTATAVPPSAAPATPALPEAPATPAEAVQDAPLDPRDVVQVLVAQKLKRSLEDIEASRTIKDLTAGKSTLQNEIVGDLQKELGSGVPEKPEDLSLHDLGNSISSFSGTLGKHSSSQIARLFSTKMPGGFTVSSARNHLHSRFGLGSGRQDSVLLLALAMEPASRVDNGSAATIWLDSIAQLHAKRAGISLSTAVANGQGSHGSGAVAPAISSAEFEKMQKEQRALIIHQIQALAHHAGIDLREGSKARDAAVSASEKYQQRLDGLVHELGDDFLDGVAGIFEARKARVFDSSWNWARQALYEHIHSILTGAEGEQPPELSLARQHYLVNCASRPLLGHISGISAILQGSEDRRVQYAIELCASLSKACERALHQDPVYREFSFPTCPQTHIDAKGSTTYREALRSTEPSFAEYIEHMKAEENGQSPMLHLKAVQSSGRWEYCQKQTAEYFACLEDINTSGLSFSGKTALVTGCGKGSIGAQVLRRMLAGGAQVVATTSSYSRRTLQFFEDMYRECGAKGSQLVVVPFNQGSADDVTALVGYIYSKKGLGWDLDYAVPFAAISEVGSDISQITSRSELAHRIMLTNLVRLLGEIRQTKALLHLETRPTLAVLPLSPNHGVFGGDGLYGESKIALETLANRWRSESWADYLSIAGAAIGWTRGTGLMDGNNLVAEKIEAHGVRTFSTVEMAFNILGLMHDGICDLTQTAPVWADLNGGFDRIDDLKGAVTMARSEITSLGNKRKMVSTDSALDYYTIHGPGTARSPITLPASVLANHQVRFPKVRTTTQLAHLKYMEGMINLDKVVVVTGFGEVGPYGSSACRWEMEAYGEFSLEGCIELAWVMGYTKHFNGPMMATGKHYTGWVDCTTGEPVHNMDIKAKYEKRILEHTGIRFIEPELHNGYDPNRKTIMCELQIEHDMEPFEASSEAARQFKLKNGDRVDIWENAEGAWMVKFLKGAVIVVPKAMRFDRLVAAQIPSGWDPVRYGIQEDLVRQIDPITCYALVATVEALLRAGVTDPYELYQYFHVSEVGSTVGSGLGGCNSIQNVFHNRSLDKDMNSDVLQETFINVAAAWVNMLLLSSAGPVKPVVGACATSVLSIDVAVETIQSGKARVMLAGGIDDFAEDPSYEFAMMGATSNAVDEIANGRAPAEMSRPCTTTRNGFMEGEGAGIVLLMSASAAIEAGAPIYGIIAMAGTATDKQGRSVPAPGKGVLVSARERLASSRSRLLDMGYRRRQLKRRRLEIDNWVAEEMAIAEEDADAIQAEADAQRKEAMDTWGNSFWCRNPQISPLRGSLAVWGLTVDDIGAASFHGTSTKANDKNESALINTQLKHLGRTPGHAVPAVCQKWLTGHPKGAAAAWMLNGALQILDTGIIPGNRNADNISSELEEYDLIFYPNKSLKTSGVKAVLLKSFGFGQVGGEVLAVHPDYLLAALPDAELSAYQAKVQQRAQQATRYWQDVLVGNHSFVQAKDSPPFSGGQEQRVYLDPLARTSYDPTSRRWKF